MPVRHRHPLMVRRVNDSYPTGRLTRRALMRGLSGVATGAALMAAGIRRVSAHAELEMPPGVEIPPEIGQTDLVVYIPETGHTLRGTFLDYWRANGGAAVYGYPISEPFASPDGYYSQAFERGIFQYRPEFLWTDEPIVRLMPIHDLLLDGVSDVIRRDSRRMTGGGYRRSTAWRSVAPDSRVAVRALANDGLYFEATGHTVRGQFSHWYRAHEGHYYLGQPVSEPMRDGGRIIQYFEGGLLEAGDDRVALAPIGRMLAERLGLDTRRVEQGDLPTYDEALFLTSPNPNPIGDLTSPGRKWIEVNASADAQQLWAYQGETVIMTSLVSTGLAPNLTELGIFHVRLKYPEQDMRGFTSSTGEVIGFGEDAPGGTLAYDVKDVPHVMYINLDAEALHGTYWHNNFGQRMSHGCINLPLDVAAFLYGWAPLGTMVWVHE